MPTELSSQDGTSLSFTLQPEFVMSSGASNTVDNADDLVSVRSSLAGEESSTGSSSRRLKPTGHSHAHSLTRSHSHSHAEADRSHPDLDAGEPSASFSELRYLFCWVQKSLPFIVILCSKLILQHALGKQVKKSYVIIRGSVHKSKHFALLQGWRLELVCLRAFCM